MSERPPTRLFFTSTTSGCQPWEGRPYVERMKRELAAVSDPAYELSETPEASDLIVYFEPHYLKESAYTDLLLGEEPVRRWPEKCFTVNYDVEPTPHLPGVYTSMPASQFDGDRFRAGGYLSEPNAMCKEVAKTGPGAKDLLASFRGKNTADVRGRLFAVAKRWRGRIIVAESFEWFDHSSDNQRHYALEIQRSHFALCPRGFATSSYRLYEAMQLSTAPVILADEWVPPEGPDWESFALRVAESDLESIPELLERNLHRAEEMGRKARVAWEEYFSPRNRLQTTLRSIECIRRNRCQDEASLQQAWKTGAFRASRGRRLLQAIARQTRKGAVA